MSTEEEQPKSPDIAVMLAALEPLKENAVELHGRLTAMLWELDVSRELQGDAKQALFVKNMTDLLAQLTAPVDQSKVKNYVTMTFNWDADSSPFKRAELTLYRDGATETPTTKVDAYRVLMGKAAHALNSVEWPHLREDLLEAAAGIAGEL